MDNSEFRKELHELREQVHGIRASIETEFAVTRRDIQHMSRAHTPTLIVSMIGLVLSICALFIASENRNLILTVATQTAKNTRDLENMIPIVFATPGPTPTTTTPGKE